VSGDSSFLWALALTQFCVFCFRKLYRWGFRQITTLGKRTETVYSNNDFCREDLSGICRMSSHTVDKVRRQSSQRSEPAEARRSSQDTSLPLTLVPGETLCSFPSYDLPTPVIGDDSVENLYPRHNEFSDVTAAWGASSQEHLLTPASLGLGGTMFSNFELVQSHQTKIPSADSWLQLLVSEYDKNQLGDLGSLPSVRSLSPAEEGSRTPLHDSRPTPCKCDPPII
jgi:hypothetical protein